MDAKQESSSKQKKEDEKLILEEKKRRAALAKWKKKLGPIGGLGPGFKIDGKKKRNFKLKSLINKDSEHLCRSF